MKLSISSIALIILCALTLAVIVCSLIVLVNFEWNKFLGYLPILIVVYCTTSSLSRVYNLYVKYEEDKQNKYC